MKTALDLSWKTPQEWVEVVLADFDSFLIDHADCERKASAMAMSFIAKCPDRVEIIPVNLSKFTSNTTLEFFSHGDTVRHC